MPEVVRRHWARFTRWLQVAHPDLFADLRPGATPEDLAFLAEEGVPDGWLAWYALNDGAGPVLADGWDWMPLLDGAETVASELASIREIADEEDEDPPSVVEGPVRPVWWHDRWIPFATDYSGCFLCIDLDPAPGGDVGQVIELSDDGRHVRFPSVEAFLEDLADRAEAGLLDLDPAAPVTPPPPARTTVRVRLDALPEGASLDVPDMAPTLVVTRVPSVDPRPLLPPSHRVAFRFGSPTHDVEVTGRATLEGAEGRVDTAWSGDTVVVSCARPIPAQARVRFDLTLAWRRPRSGANPRIPRPATPPATGPEHDHAALYHETTGDLAQAARHRAAALAAEPSRGRRRALARVLLALGRASEALPHVAPLEDDDRDEHYLRARVLLEAGRAADALDAAACALATDPWMPSALLVKARALAGLGRDDDAIATLDALRALPTLSEAERQWLAQLRAEMLDEAPAAPDNPLTSELGTSTAADARVEGDDVVVTVELTAAQAREGLLTEVRDHAGQPIGVRLPPGAFDGARLRLPGLGVAGRGDLFVVVRIVG